MSSSMEIYDPRLGKWIDGEPMNEPRGYIAAAVLKESMYVIGGIQSGEDIVEPVCVQNISLHFQHLICFSS